MPFLKILLLSFYFRLLIELHAFFIHCRIISHNNLQLKGITRVLGPQRTSTSLHVALPDQQNLLWLLWVFRITVQVCKNIRSNYTLAMEATTVYNNKGPHPQCHISFSTAIFAPSVTSEYSISHRTGRMTWVPVSNKTIKG